MIKRDVHDVNVGERVARKKNKTILKSRRVAKGSDGSMYYSTAKER